MARLALLFILYLLARAVVAVAFAARKPTQSAAVGDVFGSEVRGWVRMDLELLASDATWASRVYLSGSRGCLSGKKLLQRGLGLLLLDRPDRLQDLLDGRLDFRSRRRCLVVSVLLLDNLDTARDTLVTPEVFPAGEDVVGCPGHFKL